MRGGVHKKRVEGRRKEIEPFRDHKKFQGLVPFIQTGFPTDDSFDELLHR